MPDTVKPRMYGGGDGFANGHRKLPRGYTMWDFDGMLFKISENKLFVEGAPQGFDLIRQVYWLAIFDRKINEAKAFSKEEETNLAVSLAMTRDLTHDWRRQLPVKFFFICGYEAPPWTLIEVDPYTGQQYKKQHIITEDTEINWYKVWENSGIVKLRNNLLQHKDLEEMRRKGLIS